MTSSLKIRINNESGLRLDLNKAERIASTVLGELGYRDGELGINFVSGEEIAALNKRYLNKDKVTDVMAFPIDAGEAAPITDDSIPKLLGDVVICPEAAARNADNLGHDLENELCLLIIHGILHLDGFDHETDAGEMDEKQSVFYEEICKQDA